MLSILTYRDLSVIYDDMLMLCECSRNKWITVVEIVFHNSRRVMKLTGPTLLTEPNYTEIGY